MITFRPSDLRERLAAAKATLAAVTDWDDIPVEGDLSGYDDLEITESTDTSLYLHEGIYPIEGTVGEVLQWAEWLERGRLVDRGTVVVPGQTIFHALPVHVKAESATYNGYPYWLSSKDVEVPYRLGDIGGSVDLVVGFTAFSLFAEKELDCDDKINPSYTANEVFVVVSYERDIPLEVARALACSYLFELASMHGLVFELAEFLRSPFDDLEELEDDEETEGIQRLALRPLDVSRGMPGLYALYLQAAAANSDEWAFVSFVSVIEYVSTTVIKRTAHSELRSRLMVPEALRPDAPYLDSLIQLVNQQREYAKQREAIRRTLLECCDPSRVTGLLPTYLQGVKRSASASRDEKAMFDELAEAIVATRNSLVHAKAAYDSTGKECPDAELQQFITCVKEIAFQAVVWYQGLPEHARVAPP